MLKPRQMSHLFITGSKKQMEPVIKELYHHNVFHIKEFVEQEMEGVEGLKIGMPLPGASDASSKLIKIRSIENALGIQSEDVILQKRVSVQELEQTIDTKLTSIGSEVEQLQANKSKCETEIKDLEQKINELKPFAAVPIPLEMFTAYRTIAVFAGTVSKIPDLKVLNETYFSDTKDGKFIAVFVPAEHSGQVQMSLLQANFVPVSVPRGEGLPQELLNRYTEQIGIHKKELTLVQKQLEAIKKDQIEFLTSCEELLSADVEKAEAPLRFATTEEAFLAEGWVPADEVTGLTEAIMRVTGGKCSVSQIPIDLHHDQVPMEYDNPSFSRPTEMILNIYSRPKYTEIDPTLIVSIVFPLFFGLILGDVAYGLILLAVSMFLRKYITKGDGKDLIDTMRNFSISAIGFGILYSEFLGFELPWHPIIFSRHLNIGGGEGGASAAIPELMVMSIWIGILHITLGRVFGIINHARMDHGAHRIKAVVANIGWLLLMWGIIAVIWSMFPIPYMPDLRGAPIVAFGLNLASVTGGVALVLGIGFIAWENVLEVIELPTIISHTLSYARIVAVGLSSVAIAMVVNYIAIGMIIAPQLKNLSAVGVILVIIGVLVFIVGHIGNTVLGLVGGGLQSLRLQYVEFFTKFYKGGGIKYVPFGMKRRFTED